MKTEDDDEVAHGAQTLRNLDYRRQLSLRFQRALLPYATSYLDTQDAG